MKTILAPTDFSDTANNAIDYAVEIAKINKAKLILFHAYDVPVIPAELSVALTVDEIENAAMNGLKLIANSIHQKHGEELEIQCSCKCGFAVEEINLSAEENKADLIVMGMEGAGFLTEKIIGSTTTSLIKKAKFPVLAIDKQVKYKSIKKIALACDYVEANDKSAIRSLKEFINLFQSQLYVINVIDRSEIEYNVKKEVAAIKIEQLLETFPHSSHYIKNTDVIEGINTFIDEKAIDMLVMIPRTHTVLYNLFREPNTKRMAFHSKIPLLALHDKK